MKACEAAGQGIVELQLFVVGEAPGWRGYSFQ